MACTKKFFAYLHESWSYLRVGGGFLIRLVLPWDFDRFVLAMHYWQNSALLNHDLGIQSKSLEY